ncbi:MAG: ComF family protein [Anaerolineales bacterium]
MHSATPKPFFDPHRWLDAVLDLLYPPHCVACGRAGAWLCEECLEGAPLFEGHTARYTWCSEEKGREGVVYSVGPHVPPLRQAVHALKYEGARVLSEPLGELMAATWRGRTIPVDLVIPVPLHVQRVRRRGYSQSLLLARQVARCLDLLLCHESLIRVRDTRSQVGLSPRERWDNVCGAFRTVSGEPAGARILLVDDVMTTGATLKACSLALREGGARQVVCLTLTRAVGGM